MTPGGWWRSRLSRTSRQQLSRRSRQDLLGALGVPQPDRSGGSVAFLRRRTERAEPGCPACRVADEETRRWFFFYESETNTDETLRARLVAAGGMCAPHTRLLLDQGASSSWLGKSQFDLLVRDARAHPHGDPGRRPEPCPVCAAVGGRVADLLGMLAAALAPPPAAASSGGYAEGWEGDPPADEGTGDTGTGEVLTAYRSGAGLCVPHTREFVAIAPARATALVAGVLAERLATTPELAAGLLTGDDTDAAARARLRTAAGPGVLRADATARRAGLPDRIEALLSRPCCPVCAARATTTWRLLDWIGSGRALTTGAAGTPAPDLADDPDVRGRPGAQRGADGRDVAPPEPTGSTLLRRDGVRPRGRAGPGTGVRDQLASICATHLADLVRSDGAGGWLSEPVATVVRLAASRWRAAAVAATAAADRAAGTASDSAPDAPARPRDSGMSRGWSRPRSAAQLLTPSTACLVCSQAAQAADREVVLLRLIGADPTRWTRIAASHGPCQRCRAAVTAPGGSAGAPWEQAATARTAELAFELSEALRQDSWTARWDVHGAERSAWRRAPTRLDGAVLGPPAPGTPAPAPVVAPVVAGPPTPATSPPGSPSRADSPVPVSPPGSRGR